MPAQPRRNRNRRADAIAARSEAREIDDVLGRRYDFLNHCLPRGLSQRYRRKPSRKRSMHRSNFTGAIEAAFLAQVTVENLRELMVYNHFFHLKNT
jgi:hypothetical protein